MAASKQSIPLLVARNPYKVFTKKQQLEGSLCGTGNRKWKMRRRRRRRRRRRIAAYQAYQTQACIIAAVKSIIIINNINRKEFCPPVVYWPDQNWAIIITQNQIHSPNLFSSIHLWTEFHQILLQPSQPYLLCLQFSHPFPVAALFLFIF